ncbi:hypothetical protein LG634_19285 [Streptomyces bambusae]|uniref:hypothetical protein n=1 Tax=Streptomyces bambusae TaxID=1550616 RepID=UPI001CFCAA92|nr:hypothetical protein [Streptomyces bambusae]MCB5166975.1 hypothetical protein [Streptomyces bambusae]
MADTSAVEADRRARNAFGCPTDTACDGCAGAWLASAVHLAASERALNKASWS